MAAALLSQASSFLSRSAIWSNYTASGGKTVIGGWTVTSAVHNSNSKRVSIFEFDKSSTGSSKRGGSARTSDVCLKILKSEASKLSRMRHPCMLEVVEPLEETRSGLVFATEPVQCSLREAIRQSASTSNGRNPTLELDEVEIQKGLLQICKALQFLHDSNMTHGNLTTDAIVLNAKGDWKLAGLAFTNTATADAQQSPVDDYTDADSTLPSSVQIDLDFAAPECVVHHDRPSSASDMWSLGCVSYSLLAKTTEAPFSNRGRTANYRRNLESLESKRATWKRLGSEAEDLLASLLQRSPSQRVTAATLPTACSYFSSILVSTLRFLDRDTFFSKSVSEQVSFLKGLQSVLPRFSDRVRRQRVLPGLLEQGLGKGMRREIVPSLLPNVFYICQEMERDEFQTKVLPSLKELFILQASDPPECALALLEYLPALQQKCSAALFKDEMTPLLLSLLSSAHPPLLIKTLQTIPALCSPKEGNATSAALETPTVKDVIFPKVAETFARTTVLGVKVAGLVCLGGLIPVLDKYTLTEKLVPMLAKIKTKEPAVLLSCLTIFSLLSNRLTDPIMISTLILPQLWTMSAAPLLEESHFNRFMALIDQLGQLVKTERGKELRNLSRTAAPEPVVNTSDLSWEDLVRGGASQNGAAMISSRVSSQQDAFSRTLTPDGTSTNGVAFFQWSDSVNNAQFPSPDLPQSNNHTRPIAQRQPAAVILPPPINRKSNLGARSVAPSTFDSSAFTQKSSSMDTMKPMQPMQPNAPLNPILQPASGNQAAWPTSTNAPLPSWSVPSNTFGSESTPNPWSNSNAWSVAPPPGFNTGGAILQPSRPTQSSVNFNGWKDLDPLG